MRRAERDPAQHMQAREGNGEGSQKAAHVCSSRACWHAAQAGLGMRAMQAYGVAHSWHAVQHACHAVCAIKDCLCVLENLTAYASMAAITTPGKRLTLVAPQFQLPVCRACMHGCASRNAGYARVA